MAYSALPPAIQKHVRLSLDLLSKQNISADTEGWMDNECQCFELMYAFSLLTHCH